MLIVDDYEYNIMGLRAILGLIKNIERVDEVHNGKDARSEEHTSELQSQPW